MKEKKETKRSIVQNSPQSRKRFHPPSPHGRLSNGIHDLFVGLILPNCQDQTRKLTYGTATPAFDKTVGTKREQDDLWAM